MVLTKYGTIENGNCDKIHIARAEREAGALGAIEYLYKNNFIIKCSGGFKIEMMPNLPRVGTTEHKLLFLKKMFKANYEIGFLRFINDVVLQLVKDKRIFLKKQLKLWAVDIASFEFIIQGETPLSIITPNEKVYIGYIPPHQDFVYKSKKKDGVL